MNESAPTVPLLALVVGDLGSFCCFLTCSIMNESAPTRPLLLLALEGDRTRRVRSCSIMNESDTDFGEERSLVAARAVMPHRDGGFGTCENVARAQDVVKVVGGSTGCTCLACAIMKSWQLTFGAAP